ncbi:hypothetical protein JHK85_044296 [Glycine max]|nr:hypothetical protein JHK85_044296 [Glycine max]
MVQEVEDLIGEMEKAFVSVDGHCVLEKGLSEEAEDVFYKERNLAGWKKDVLECNFMIQSGMKNHGTWPNESTYNSLVQMLSGANLVDQAMDLAEEMQEIGLPHYWVHLFVDGSRLFVQKFIHIGRSEAYNLQLKTTICQNHDKPFSCLNINHWSLEELCNKTEV